MQPGDLICFNNRRVLHGRNSLKLNGGVRFLKVCFYFHNTILAYLPYYSPKMEMPWNLLNSKQKYLDFK